jgi:hypothetical protein
MKTDAKYHHVPRWFEYISQLGASLLVDATGRLFRDSDYLQQNGPQAKKAKKKPTSKANTKLSQMPEDELCYESEDEEVMSPQERAKRYEEDQEGQHAKTKGQPLLTLEYLVSSMSIFDVTNPHDSVYALLGIAKDTTPTAVNKKLRVTDHTQAALEMFTAKKQYPVDYKANYIDICKEFIQFCVRRNASRDPSRALDVICRPWAIEVEEKGNELDLPSWLPRLSKASYGMVLGPGIDGMRMGRKNADSLVGLPNVTHRNYNAAETKGLDKKTFRFRKRVMKPPKPISSSKTQPLVVQNGGVDSSSATVNPPVQNISSPMSPTSPTGIGLNGVVAPAHINGVTADASPDSGVATPQSTEISPSHFSLYVKGFILDTIASVQPSSQSGSIPTAWARFAGWEQMEGTPPEHFWRTLVADRGSDGKNPPVYYSRACQESFRKGGTAQGVVDTMGLIEHERNSVVAQFCRRVQAAIWNRALVKTEAERFGLVANNVKENDLVCILYGCSVPVVLRRHGPKKQSIMDFEMETELRYIADYVVKSYRTHLARREVFRAKREKDKADYRKWELRKREEWKKDDKWESQWKLVRAGLVRIHEFRAWVTRKTAVVLEKAGDCKRADDTICTMRNCVQTLLPQIYEIAAWSAKLKRVDHTIIDSLMDAKSDSSTPKSIELTTDQKTLWNLFVKDEDWSHEWCKENTRYLEEEGLKAWASAHKHKIGYTADKEKSTKKWEQDSAKAWTREWATENSWFLCIDPFRAWLREKGKFWGSEEVLDSKQEWENDEEWHKKRDKDELEIVSYTAWMEAKGRANPELDIARADEEISQFGDWRKNWRADNRDADMRTERAAWDEEWQKRKTDSETRRREEFKKRKEINEKRDKEAFLERWRKDWRPPTVNWQEFEIALSYGKHWLKLVRRRKRDHITDQEGWWATDHAVKQRQQARASYMRQQYGCQPPATNASESSGSDRYETGQYPEDATNGHSKSIDGSSSLREADSSSEGGQNGSTAAGAERNTEVDDDKGKGLVVSESVDARAISENGDETLGPSEASLRRRASSAYNEELLSVEDSPSKQKAGLTSNKPTSLYPNGDESISFGPPKRTKSYAQQHEEEERKGWLVEHESLLEAPFLSRAELKDWIQKKKDLYSIHWDKSMRAVDEQRIVFEYNTPKVLGKDGEFHYDLSRPKPVKEPAKEPAQLRLMPRRVKERQAIRATKPVNGRYPKGHYFGLKQRARLTPVQQAKYMSNVRETFQSRLGEDGQYYYEMLGECYVHGMMDGEAMAHQNDKGIPWAVFEIQ